MAVKTQIQRITNSAVHADGVSYLGQVEEITLPEIAFMFAEHKALGLIGTPEYFSGIEKMETSIKWTAVYKEAFLKHARPNGAVKLMVRSNVQRIEGGQTADEFPLVTYLTCAPKNYPLGSHKKSENVDLNGKWATYYIKQELDGDVLLEIDVENNIFNVNGTDYLATYRANLGI